jgi:hypothetical protein
VVSASVSRRSSRISTGATTVSGSTSRACSDSGSIGAWTGSGSTSRPGLFNRLAGIQREQSALQRGDDLPATDRSGPLSAGWRRGQRLNQRPQLITDRDDVGHTTPLVSLGQKHVAGGSRIRLSRRGCNPILYGTAADEVSGDTTEIILWFLIVLPLCRFDRGWLSATKARRPETSDGVRRVAEDASAHGWLSSMRRVGAASASRRR